jgi:hypothetical protein
MKNRALGDSSSSNACEIEGTRLQVGLLSKIAVTNMLRRMLLSATDMQIEVDTSYFPRTTKWHLRRILSGSANVILKAWN